MNRLAVVMGMVLLGLIASANAEDSGLAARQLEQEGGFSYRPPKGFNVEPVAGMKYKAAKAEAVDGFAPNIVFVDEAFAGALKAYVDANEAGVSKAFKGYKKLSREEFKTEAGAAGEKLAIEDEQLGMKLRQVFYFFDGPAGNKIVVTCSSLAKDGDKHDAAFDASMKTFKLKPKDK
jgi:hypothetical protein